MSKKRRQLTREEKERARRLKEQWNRAKSRRLPDGTKITQEKAAHALGWSGQSAVEQYLNGRIPLDIKAGLAFAQLLKVDIESIEPDWSEQLTSATNVDITDEPKAISQITNVIQVPYYQGVRPSAGYGLTPIEEASVSVMEISRAMLERLGISPASAALMQADGPSMTGVIEHNDIMLLDLSKPDGQPKDGRIYVIRVNDEIYVKRVQRTVGGFTLLSNNKLFEPMRITNEDQATDVQFIGLVAINWRMMDLTAG